MANRSVRPVRPGRAEAWRQWLDPRPLMVALAAGAVAGGLSVLARAYEVFPLDRPVTEWANGRTGWIAPVARVSNEYDEVAGIAFALIAVAVLIWRGYLSEALLFPLAVAVRWLAEGVKPVIGRPRPADLPFMREVAESSSFPSGHVLTAAVAAGLWFALAPQLVGERWATVVRGAALVYLLFSAFGRMWAGAHWFSDTYGGLVWGVTLVALVVAVRPAVERVVRALRPRAQ